MRISSDTAFFLFYLTQEKYGQQCMQKMKKKKFVWICTDNSVDFRNQLIYGSQGMSARRAQDTKSCFYYVANFIMLTEKILYFSFKFYKKAENCEGLVKPMSERLDIQTAPAKDMNSLKRKTIRNH